MNYDHKLVRIADLIAMSQRNADFPAGLSAENAPADLVKELREKGVLQLPFVGVFSIVEGAIVFQADPSLLAALNVLNDDLPVIPLSHSDGLATSEELPAATPFEAAAPPHASKSDELTIDLSEDGPIPSDPPKIELPNLVAPVPTVSSSHSDSTSKRTRNSEKSRQTHSRRSVSAVRSERQSSSKGLLLLVAGFAIIIVAIISFWPLLQKDAPIAQDDGPVAKNDSSFTAFNDSSLATQADSLGTASETVQAPDSPEASPSPKASTEGEILNPANTVITSETNGYTIIVRSALSRSIAEAVLKQYESLNLPMGVLTTKEDSVTRFRTGIGVYPTAKLADLARESLGEKIPSDSWAFRIR